METILILIYSIILVSSFLLITVKHPIYSLIFGISIYFNSSLLFIILGLDFWGLMLLSIYAGAIAVLFLFVIMMVNIKYVVYDKTTYLIIGLFIVLSLFLQLVHIFFYKFYLYTPEHLFYNFNNYLFIDVNTLDESNKKLLIQKLGYLTFKEYPIFLIVSGFILLISMVGSIFLTNLKKGYFYRKQYNQVIRNNHLFHVYIY